MAKRIKKIKGIVFVISGPSGSGKTTLISRLCKKKRLKSSLFKIISYTTRCPRGKEKNKKDYIFITKNEFKRKIKKREFLEWQNVFGEYYGTPKQEVVENIKKGNDVVLCIDVKGAKAFRKLKGFSSVYIFILPSEKNWQHALKARLKGRRSDSAPEMRKRLLLAEKEIASAKSYDYLVLNKDIILASEELAKIVDRERRRKE